MLLFAQIVTVAMCLFGLYGSYILAEKDDSWLKRVIDRGTDATVKAIHRDINEEIRRNADKYLEGISPNTRTVRRD